MELSSEVSNDFLRHGYELRSKLGSGSMGNVYLVFSKKYNLLFASKQILKLRHPQNNEDIIPLTSSRSKKSSFQSDHDQIIMKRVQIDPIINSTQNQIRSSASSDIENYSISRSSIERILKSDSDLIAEESKNEIQSLMLLDHPNVVKMYEVFEEGDYIYMILEYCKNNSLKDFVNLKPEKRLEGKELFNCVLQMTLAVQYCHSMNIAHRDIKPANFLLDQYYRLKLADFGLSMANKAETPNDDPKVCGSPAYMSPELLTYRKSNALTKSSSNFNSNEKEEAFFTGNIDLFKADIWALGINIYEIASGIKPFVGTIDQIRKQVMHSFEKPKEIEDASLIKLLRGMLKINPTSRYTFDQIFNSDYFINNGYNDSQSIVGSSYLLQPVKSTIMNSQPASITPSLPNTQSFISRNSTRNRTRCLASTSSFLSKRPTKLTASMSSLQANKKGGSTVSFNTIKTSSQQTIITPKKRISSALQLLASNAVSCQDTFNMYNQFSDDQRDSIMLAPHLPVLKEEPEPQNNNLPNFSITTKNNKNPNESNHNAGASPNMTMQDVFASVGNGHHVTSNYYSKTSSKQQVIFTQPTSNHNI